MKLIALGKDGKVHCVDVLDKTKSACSEQMPIIRVNPDFSKAERHPYWCYECSDLLEKENK